MLKKCVSLLLTVCFLMIFCVTAHGDTIYESEFDIPGSLYQYCDVQKVKVAWGVKEDTPDEYGSYAYYDEETHTYTLRRWYYCNGCGAGPVRTYQDYTMIGSHHLKYDTDGGHVGGTALHLRNRSCRKCGDFSITYTCFGPPCAVCLRMDGLAEVE